MILELTLAAALGSYSANKLAELKAKGIDMAGFAQSAKCAAGGLTDRLRAIVHPTGLAPDQGADAMKNAVGTIFAGASEDDKAALADIFTRYSRNRK